MNFHLPGSVMHCNAPKAGSQVSATGCGGHAHTQLPLRGLRAFVASAHLPTPAGCSQCWALLTSGRRMDDCTRGSRPVETKRKNRAFDGGYTGLRVLPTITDEIHVSE